MKNIYLVTTVHVGAIRQHGELYVQRKRSVGWFSRVKDAKETVLNNYGDIYECGHYNHCVIESTKPGLYPHVDKEYWYKWDIEEKQYISIPKPDGLERFVNFGIG